MSHARSDPRPTPDGITPLVGYRYWNLSVGPEPWTLRSLNGELVHEVNVHQPVGQGDNAWLVARCLTSDHDAPEERCACGFYAVKTFSTLRSRTASFVSTDPEAVTHRVAGRVHLAGKIVEHDLGYRAERMQIAELRPFRGTERTVARFAQRLGVPAGEPIDPPGPVELLTSSEMEVIRLLAEGRPTQEIIERLHVSNRNVRRMIGHILEKLRQPDSTA
jgi:predicted DNA-binding protein (UPF0251 family)